MDAVNQTKNGNSSNNSTLQPWERVQLALTSYVELVIDFAFLYYLFSPRFLGEVFPWFQTGNIRHVLESLYVSGATMTTLGPGSMEPLGFIARLLSIWQVTLGLLLLVVAFALYVAKPAISGEEVENDGGDDETTPGRTYVVKVAILDEQAAENSSEGDTHET